MEITLYNFAKRERSTKVPTSDNIIAIKDVTLKNECSLTSPSFFLTGFDNASYIKAWNNYYFITNRSVDINGAQYIDCEIDVLATWKSQILATSAYVLYSSSDYDINVIDNRIAHEITKQVEIEVEETMFVGSNDGGCYCISASGIKYGATGWIVSTANFIEIVEHLISAGSSVWQSLIELFGDAVGSIIGARYIPIPYSYFANAGLDYDEVVLGDHNTGTPGYVTQGYAYQSVQIAIPWIYNDFRRCHEYTSMRLFLPFVGIVELLPENLLGHSSLRVEIACNCITGKISYGVWTDAGVGEVVKLIGTYSAEFGREVPIATDQINAVGVIGGGTTAGVGAITGMAKNIAAPLANGGLGGGILTIGAMIAGLATLTVAANRQDFVTVGGFGGGYSEVIASSIYLQSQVNVTRTEPSELTELYGRPCMKVKQLSELTGFVLTDGFQIDISATSKIRETINNLMNSGVYLE